MCFLCDCIIWGVEYLQRALSFCVTGVLLCIMCIGVTISIVAGIAYGYNYSLSEFITFTRYDVVVYQRAGKPYDRPDLEEYEPRRFMNEPESDMGEKNSTEDEENIPAYDETQLLSESLENDDDTRRYAEKLSKFSKSLTIRTTEVMQEIPEGSVSYFKFSTPPGYRIPTTTDQEFTNHVTQLPLLDSGTPSLVMRKFSPIKDIGSDTARRDPDEYFYKVGDFDENDKIKSKMRMHKGLLEEEGDMSEKSLEDMTRRTIPMRHFHVSTSDPDEELIAYKPV